MISAAEGAGSARPMQPATPQTLGGLIARCKDVPAAIEAALSRQWLYAEGRGLLVPNSRLCEAPPAKAGGSAEKIAHCKNVPAAIDAALARQSRHLLVPNDRICEPLSAAERRMKVITEPSSTGQVLHPLFFLMPMVLRPLPPHRPR